MKKEQLAQLLSYISGSAKKREYYIYVIDAGIWANSTVDFLVEYASNAAGTRLIKGKLSLKGKYLVSRGKELPFLNKPCAIAEYSSHWPFDFCYFYRL